MPSPSEPPAPDPDSKVLAIIGVATGGLFLVALGFILISFCLSGESSDPEPAAPTPVAKAPAPAPQVKPPPQGSPNPQGQPPLPKAEAVAKPPLDIQKQPVGRKKREEQEDLPPGAVVRNGNKEGRAHPSLTPDEQKRVNTAIDEGVKFVRQAQLGGGSWSAGAYSLGYAALAGLTLLECGAPANDPAVQKAARFVRMNSTSIDHSTYQLSLAVLFLDRLGEAKDKALIRTMALRLIMGQNSAGGWDYKCPLLTVPEQQLLLTFLRQNGPRPLRDPIAQTKPGTLPDPLGKTGAKELPDPVSKATQPGPLPEAIPGKQQPPDPAHRPGETPPPNPAPNPKPAPQVNPGAGAPRPLPKMTTPPRVVAERPAFLPPVLRSLPPAQIRGSSNVLGRPSGRDDNSNTQFAILALWAARRHDVPVEQSLALAEARFRASQRPGGGWGYPYQGGGQTGPMTCVGLLGLAAGLGADKDGQAPGANAVQAKNPTIERGLQALGQSIDHPGKGKRGVSAYFLWSVERVGVLYDLRTIGKKDWYRWGVEILLPSQRADGSWHLGGSHGSDATLDTCMALLFLKRANLTEDLTRNLRLYLAITDPDAVPHGPAPK
ncbi:MAG: hypothetical protein L0Z62_32630 [Gemmataceae bacterium]|nr:hypothetical protein [Gemmataceae bacterium]